MYIGLAERWNVHLISLLYCEKKRERGIDRWMDSDLERKIRERKWEFKKKEKKNMDEERETAHTNV